MWGQLVGELLPDHAAHVGDLEARHVQPTGSSTGAAGATGAASASGLLPRRLSRSISSTGFPRACATLSAVRSARRAAIVARTRVAGVFVASDFVIISFPPESSTTARLAPPPPVTVPRAVRVHSTL